MMKKWIILLLSVILAVFSHAAVAEERTTTVLMYICGTDLQNCAVEDIYEMCAVETPDSVNVVIQAGGAKEWDDVDMKPDAINRFCVEYEYFIDLHYLPDANMGEADTLADFLTWGMEEYPADRYVLVMWNHGGGAVDGVCFDETSGNDSLTVHELYDAFSSCRAANGDFHLDIVGFDACLMATYEVAAHLREFADYMVASEELEPGSGWDYDGWLQALADDPGMDSQTLAIYAADTFMDESLAYNPDDYLSMSVVYLPAMDGLVAAMEEYSAHLTEALENGQMSTFSRARQRMYAFGGCSDASSDMVDMMAFLEATRQFAPRTAVAVKQAYQQAVRYSIGTEAFDYLTGMSILMPYETLDYLPYVMDEYACRENIPNYTQFVRGYTELMNGGDYAFSEQTPVQVDGTVVSLIGDVLNTIFAPLGSFVAEENEVVEVEDVTSELPEPESVFDFDATIQVGAVTPVYAEEQFEVDETAVYAASMTLSPDEIANLSYVEGVLLMDASDEVDTIYIELGAMQNAGINWETGEIVSLFDGSWPVLDEQLVVIYDEVVTGSLRRSLIPVLCNGEQGYLQITFTTARPEGVIVGFTPGYDEDHHIPARGTVRLEEGDVIVPLYPMIYLDASGEFVDDMFEGEPIVAGPDGALDFYFLDLTGGESYYLYCFCLTDIYGEETYSDFIEFYL